MPYHRLDVFKRAYELALKVHRMSLTFPKQEQYELAQQLRRSSKSIPANIAEGMGKQESKADVRRFIRIAVGSCDESRVWLEFARDLGYINKEQQCSLDESYREVGRMLQGLIRRYSDPESRI
jgi:four helix bundle protein